MTGDDVLTDLRAWRDEFARSHGHDLAAMAATLRERDAAAGTRVVRGKPRRPVVVPPPVTVTPCQPPQPLPSHEAIP